MASWLPNTAWEPWAPGAAKWSKQALKTGSKTAATSRDSESRFSGLLELLWVLRQRMCSLRSLQNECIVFVPPGACRVGSVVWGGCFGLVFQNGFLAPPKWLGSHFGSPGLLELPKEANRLSKPALKRLLPHVTQRAALVGFWSCFEC